MGTASSTTRSSVADQCFSPSRSRTTFNPSQSFSSGSAVRPPASPGQEDGPAGDRPPAGCWSCVPCPPGAAVTATGQLRSLQQPQRTGATAVVSVLCPDPPARLGEGPVHPHSLSGVLCKPPTRRGHATWGREICDIILAVNRRYGRADYLPPYRMGSRMPRQTSILAVAPQF